MWNMSAKMNKIYQKLDKKEFLWISYLHLVS